MNTRTLPFEETLRPDKCFKQLHLHVQRERLFNPTVSNHNLQPLTTLHLYQYIHIKPTASASASTKCVPLFAKFPPIRNAYLDASAGRTRRWPHCLYDSTTRMTCSQADKFTARDAPRMWRTLHLRSEICGVFGVRSGEKSFWPSRNTAHTAAASSQTLPFPPIAKALDSYCGASMHYFLSVCIRLVRA